jgi:HK97 family phage major capsid protein
LSDYAAALEELKRSVHTLTGAVESYRRDAVDRSTVENIVTDVLAAQRTVASTEPRRSVTPSDAGGDSAIATVVDERAEELRSLTGTKKLNRMLELPAAAVSGVLRRSQADVEAFQQVSDNLLLAAAIMDRPARSLDYFSDVYRPAINAALGTGSSGAGEEYVPTLLSSQLIERVNLELLVAQLFDQVDMPSNPYEIPGVAVARQAIPSATEQTGDPGPTAIAKLTLATRKITLTAKKLAAMALVSKEMEEDAVIQVIPYMQQELVDYISGSFEDALVNGDTAGTHMDEDVTVADDARKLYDGLRKSVLAGSKIDGANAALTVAMLRSSKALMGKYGARPERLAHIVSMVNAVQLLSDTAVFTLEKYGPHATILTGELARVDNVPIVVSEYARIDLNASGVFDNVTKSRSAALTVYRPGFLVGTRRGVTVEILRELYSEYDQDAVKITTRKAFEPRYPTGAELIVAEIYDLKTT